MKKAFILFVSLLAMMAAGMGLKAQGVTIVLQPGWNWIGYPYTVSADLETAFGDFVPMEDDVIKSRFGYSTYDEDYGWFGGVDELKPGWGYMYYSNRATTVIVVLHAPTSSSMVTTAEPTDITAESAVVGGTVTLPEGSHVFLRGVCWGTTPNTDIDGDHTSEEPGVGVFNSTLEGLTPGTTYYVRAYAVTDFGLDYGEEQSFTTLVEYAYVDLGLPSGTLWATCNVGANAPEEYGDYFAWGETQPKDDYGWNNYQHCYYDVDWPLLTKYCNMPSLGYNGYSDTLTTLLPEDDAATINWGADWRMPTNEEWEELIENVPFTMTEQNGVFGWLFTSENGNSLFLPAAENFNFGNSVGFYWSSSLDTDHPTCAWCYSFSTVGLGYYYRDRYYGLSVRAVRSASQSTSFVIEATANPTEGGIVNGDGTYEEGAECTLTAVANEGYTFTNWTENGEVVSTDDTYSFVVTGDRNLVANFAASAPTGAINGKFTINASGDQVYFSQGNLQYIGSASTPYWKFADNQWDVLGTTTGQNSSDQNVDRDLFGWGTSGWDSGNTYYQPWDTHKSSSSTYGPPGSYNLTGSYANADWGVYNPISNGGNQPNQWRTLTRYEWKYVFDTRSTSSGIRYAKANVNNVNGVVLLPDDWSISYYTLSNTNSTGASFSSNTISATQWSSLEQHGAVFLPAAGWRSGTSVSYVGSSGYYWSASFNNSSLAFYVYFYDSGLFTDHYSYRYLGLSVRLVAVSEN